jgi:hypothetical protein
MKAQIGMKIRKKCHISAKTAVKEILPYLRIIFENNREMAEGLAEWLDLDTEMTEYFTGKKKTEAAAEES